MSGSIGLFCRTVTEQMRCGWEKEPVAQELSDHIRDHADALMAQGVPQSEAESRAVEAMGDPVALGRALDRLHSPWPWRVLRFCTRCALAALLLAAAAWLFTWEDGYVSPDPAEAAIQALREPDEGGSILAHGSVTGGGRVGDYRLSPLGDAVLAYNAGYVLSDGQRVGEGYELRFPVEITHWQPWLGEFSPDWSYFSAEDDLGNRFGPGELGFYYLGGETRLRGQRALRLFDPDPAAMRFTVTLASGRGTVTFSVVLADRGEAGI